VWARESRDYETMGRWSIVGRRILQVFWAAAGGLYGFVGCGAFPVGGMAAFYWFLGWGVGGLDEVPFRWRDAAWEDQHREWMWKRSVPHAWPFAIACLSVAAVRHVILGVSCD
jgi:hypothetical protein